MIQNYSKGIILKVKIWLRIRWVQFGLPVLFLFLILVLWRGKGSTEQELHWAKIKQGDFYIKVSETGEIRAVHSMDVTAPMEWRFDLQIIDMVPEGTMVEKGDFLVQFDTSVLQQQLDMALDNLESFLADRRKLLAEQEAKMQQLQVTLETAKYSRDIAELQLELLQYEAEVRRQDAELDYKKALIAMKEAETNIKSQKIIDQTALNSVELKILKARGEVAELKRKIDHLTLKAPMAGMVVYDEIGSWNSRHKAAIGDKPRPGQAVVSIPNLAEMQANLRVNEMDAQRIKIGQPATITLDAYPDHQFTGKVREIAKLAQKEDWRSKIKDFEVIVNIDQSDPLLKPGMTCKADLLVGHLQSVIYVPLGAVYEKDGQAVIFTKRTFPDPIKVEIGERDNTHIVVQSDDLKEDDLLAYSAPDKEYKRVGYTDFVHRVKEDQDLLKEAFRDMEKLGLTFDYEANRNKRVIAQSDSTSPSVDIEKLRQQFRVMSSDGKAVELDPAKMKKLKKAMQGQQKPGVSIKVEQKSEPKK